MEIRAQTEMKEKIDLLSDFVLILIWLGIDLESHYVILVTPSEDDEASEMQEGTIVRMKR